MKKSTLGVIPARLHSTRLHEKPLQDISGKTLIERVYLNAKAAQSIDRLIVATDSDRIRQEVERFGGEVMMTNEDLPSGSARVCAVVEALGERWDSVVNIQGDMPFIKAELIDSIVNFFLDNYTDFDMGTGGIPIDNEAVFNSPSNVKIVLGEKSQALYFSRAPIPHSRDGDRIEVLEHDQLRPIFGYRHFGLYVYKPQTLEVFKSTSVSVLERVEKLEQLSLLEKGYRIGVSIVPEELIAGSIEVDTPEDLERARQSLLV